MILYKTRYHTVHVEHATGKDPFEPPNSILSRRDFPIQSDSDSDVTNDLRLLADTAAEQDDEISKYIPERRCFDWEKSTFQNAVPFTDFITTVEGR